MENYSIGYDLANGPDRTAVYFWDGKGATHTPQPPVFRVWIDEAAHIPRRVLLGLLHGQEFHRCRRGRWWWNDRGAAGG